VTFEDKVRLLSALYRAFNRREIDRVLAALSPTVRWPNVLEKAELRGHPAVRAYWLKQFETIEPRVFGERGLFADVVKGGPLDLGRRDPADLIDADPALTIIASRNPAVFVRHRLDAATSTRGEYRLNPLYTAEQTGNRTSLRLTFPTDDYAEEYGACRQYLPDEVVVDSEALATLAAGRLDPELADLKRRRVILDLPKRYY